MYNQSFTRMEDQEMSGPPDKTETFPDKSLPMVAPYGDKMEEDPPSI